MLKLTFLGTGEAFDPNRTTTSYLIEDDTNKYSFMVDCGYDTPKSLIRLLGRKNKSMADIPNSIIFTHEHGDHFAGISALLMAIWEESNGVVGTRKDGIQRKLKILSANSSILENVERRMELDYNGFFERFKTEGPDISFSELTPNFNLPNGITVSAARTSHGALNYAYHFTKENVDFAISGDGALTDETRKLFEGVNLLIHEGFNVNTISKNHASIAEVVDYAIESKIPHVAIVHVNREQRLMTDKIESLIDKGKDNNIKVLLSKDYDSINLDLL